MKLCYFHYLYGQGTALNHVRQFVSAVESLGHQISAHSMNLASPGNRGDAGVRDRLRASLKARFSKYLHEPKELLRNVPYIKREMEIVRREKPDVILTRASALGISSLFAARWTGTPLVLEVNGPACEARSFTDQYLHIPFVSECFESANAHQANHLTVVSDALRRYFLKRYQLRPERITVNHNGADTDRFHPHLDSSRVRQQLGLSGKKVVGYVGALKPWHGPDLLKEAICKLSAERDVVFLLVGGGADWEALGQWVSTGPHQAHVQWVGKVNHSLIPDYLAAMDVALMPDSNFYGSPLKVIEYMATGLPTVAPRYGPLQELIEHGKEGLLFAPRDIDDCVGHIKALLRNTRQRHEMGLAAATKVAQELTWRHNAQRVVAACRQACRGFRPGREPGSPDVSLGTTDEFRPETLPDSQRSSSGC